MQRRGGGDVDAPGVLDAHLRAQMQAQVARAAQRDSPPNFDSFSATASMQPSPMP
jgi:citrate lyase gamma subunit